MSRQFLDGKVTLHGGDSREVLKTLPDASVDSVVCDPPYALTNRTPDAKWCVDCNRVLGGREKAVTSCPVCGGELEYQRSAGGRGFMGKEWDTGETAFAAEFWAQVLRVLKPGGHLVAFSGTRTYHRLAVAIEDAGFEIRDQLAWVYGSGFPKSLDVSKAIDKAAGAEREVMGIAADFARDGAKRKTDGSHTAPGYSGGLDDRWSQPVTAPATDAARQWAGWGTALKPSWEPIVLARKPLIGTVAANVLAHGTGAINVDGCRVSMSAADKDNINGKHEGMDPATYQAASGVALNLSAKRMALKPAEAHALGRWPANLLHDGSKEVVERFPDRVVNTPGSRGKSEFWGTGAQSNIQSYENEGSAARFFYTAKADGEDRLGSKHPTVKPLDLMQWLVRLVTPKGGVCLDPFAGTGTTGEACFREGMRAILIEREEEYQADIARRMELATQPTKRAAVAATKNQLDDPNSLPLFGGWPMAAE